MVTLYFDSFFFSSAEQFSEKMTQICPGISSCGLQMGRHEGVAKFAYGCLFISHGIVNKGTGVEAFLILALKF